MPRTDLHRHGRRHSSNFSPSPVGQLAARLGRIPAKLMKVAKDVANDKADVHLSKAEDGVLTSVEPSGPPFTEHSELPATMPRPDKVYYHSIIRVVPVDQAPVGSTPFSAQAEANWATRSMACGRAGLDGIVFSRWCHASTCTSTIIPWRGSKCGGYCWNTCGRCNPFSRYHTVK